MTVWIMSRCVLVIRWGFIPLHGMIVWCWCSLYELHHVRVLLSNRTEFSSYNIKEHFLCTTSRVNKWSDNKRTQNSIFWGTMGSEQSLDPIHCNTKTFFISFLKVMQDWNDTKVRKWPHISKQLRQHCMYLSWIRQS